MPTIGPCGKSEHKHNVGSKTVGGQSLREGRGGEVERRGFPRH